MIALDVSSSLLPFPGLDIDHLGTVICFPYTCVGFLPVCRFSWISEEVGIVTCEGPFKTLSLCPRNCAYYRWCSTILF